MAKLLVLMIVVIVIVMVECIREICTFKVTHYNIKSQKLMNIKEKKIILLSDLHNYEYGKNNVKLLNAIKNQNPDLILVAGDMLVGKSGISPEIAIDFMKQLPCICDTYFANGNHEQRMKEKQEIYGQTFNKYKAQLVKSGVNYLENEKAEIKWEQVEIEISGLEIPSDYYRKFQKVVMAEDCMKTCLGEADISKYQILIAHNPIFMEEYLKWGADLVVSGHLHGGVARIPFWRGIITPQGGLFPKYSGEMKKIGEAVAVVSRGIGIHTIPIRFMNPAEIVVLHVSGVEE